MITALSALLAMLTAASPAGAQTTLHVSRDGSDANPGTREQPFATLERARDAVRALNRDMEADIIVQLAGGVHRLRSTLSFGPQDSGTNGHRVIYRAAPGEEVVLSGGVPVSGWEEVSEGLLRAPADLANFRQLWVNGRRARRARGDVPAGLEPIGESRAIFRPDPGQEAVEGVHVVGSLEVAPGAGYRVPDRKLADWRNPSDIEFGYYNSWTHMICRVDSIRDDGDGAVITMAEPGYYLARNKPGVQAGLPAYIENALELLDEPGEWYFDRPARTVYYRPLPGEDMGTAEVIAPALTTLLHVAGTLDSPVHDLAFEGITFAHATWLQPSELGHPDVQANFIAPSADAVTWKSPPACTMAPSWYREKTLRLWPPICCVLTLPGTVRRATSDGGTPESLPPPPPQPPRRGGRASAGISSHTQSLHRRRTRWNSGVWIERMAHSPLACRC